MKFFTLQCTYLFRRCFSCFLFLKIATKGRTWVFDPADACLSDRRLRTAGDLDLYHFCSAAVAGDPVSVVPNLLGGHCDGTYDLLLAGGEEAAEGRRSSGAGIEFETMQCDH